MMPAIWGNRALLGNEYRLCADCRSYWYDDGVTCMDEMKRRQEAKYGVKSDLRAELATALGVPAEVVTVENIKKAIENLGFYGNISDYKAPYTGGLGKLYFDCGEKARDGLAPFQTGK
jgi:hypothetical protein